MTRSKKRVAFDGDLIPLPSVGADRSLGDVRADLRHNLAEGEPAYCLCCGATTKVYARGLNHMMVRSLALLAQEPYGLASATITRRTGQTGGGDTAKLAHWGLIESVGDTVWKITPMGRQFLSGDIRLPHKALIYIDKLIGFDASITVSVTDVVGKAFNLDEVMAASPVVNSVVEVAA